MFIAIHTDTYHNVTIVRGNTLAETFMHLENRLDEPPEQEEIEWYQATPIIVKIERLFSVVDSE